MAPRRGSRKPAKHNLKTGGQVPVEIIAEVDRKIDDGKPNSGGFQFSTYDPNTNNPVIDDCTSAGQWNISNRGRPTAAAPACSDLPSAMRRPDRERSGLFRSGIKRQTA